jgi:hypothetical protein
LQQGPKKFGPQDLPLAQPVLYIASVEEWDAQLEESPTGASIGGLARSRPKQMSEGFPIL